jgi:hypothetical protein
MQSASPWTTMTSSPASRLTTTFTYQMTLTIPSSRTSTTGVSRIRCPQPGSPSRQTMTTTLPKPQRSRILVLESRRATGHANSATTHLLPRMCISALKKKEAWYLRGDMQVWNSNQIPKHINMTRDIANCLLLCSNLDKTFDDRIFPRDLIH